MKFSSHQQEYKFRRLPQIAKKTCCALVTVWAFAGFSSAALAGNTLTWDASSSGTFPSGYWSTSSSFPYWSNGSGYSSWQDVSTTAPVDTALFPINTAGTTAQVTINNDIGAAQVIFKGSGYTLKQATTARKLTLGSGGIDASQVTSGTITINNPITLVSGQNWTNGATSLIQEDGSLAGSASLTKSGAGQLILTNANNKFYSGAVVVAGGTLQLAGSSSTSTTAITGTGSLTVTGDGSGLASDTNGILQLGNNEQINVKTALTLAGGTFSMNGHNETLGALTLAGSSGDAHSIISFGSESGIVTFADSSGSLGSGYLDIQGWNGLTTGGGSDQLVISGSSLSIAQLSQIQFVNPNGGGGNFAAQQLGTGEIVPGSAIAPTPEPGSLFTLIFGFSTMGCFIIARRRRTPSMPDGVSFHEWHITPAAARKQTTPISPNPTFGEI